MQVLYIDDNEMNRPIVENMLSLAEVEVTEAESAEVGLKLLDQRAFDMILLDLRMPGMDGLTALRLIRSRGDAQAAVPVVIITADASPTLRAECLSSGADDLLHKPVSMEQLFETMARLCAGTQGVI